MANENNILSQDFPLSFNSYATFDATTIKSLMQERLTQGGVFTDQIFEGSNFNSLLDIIAYSYHVLLFYLNRTSNEASFSTAQLYENVNRIVKILNYNPIGIQTSVLSLSAAATENLQSGIYTIPKYSYFSVNDVKYSFNEDLIFTKSTNSYEILNDLNESSLLYQGEFVQYPTYISTGESFEEFSIVSVNEEGENDLIDHNNIHVYVKENKENSFWKQYKKVNSLYLESRLSESFELRLNENQRYTIKFGNGINGKKLNKGDFISVFYLKSDGTNGEFGSNVINGSRLFLYNTPLYSEIMSDIRDLNSNILEISESIQINFTNPLPSSKFTYHEDVTSIKNNAKNTYKTQYRLINNSDYENYIKKNFSNIIQDVKVVDNTQFVDEHLSYYKNIGLNDPFNDSRILFNQINFSNSCNFNNVNIYCIPKVPQNQNSNFNRYINVGLKNKIKDELNLIKIITADIVFQDPVYVSVGLGIASSEEIYLKRLYPEIITETSLVIKKYKNSFINDNSIIENIVNLFKNYFENIILGKTIDINYLQSSILSINGVESLYMRRFTKNNIELKTNSLNLLSYNPVYNSQNEDIEIIDQSKVLPFYKAAFFSDYGILRNNIIIE